MSITIHQEVKKEAFCIKLIAKEGDRPVGRCFLYVLYNDLHVEPFAFLEDVFVDTEYRSRGIGKQLVEGAVAVAKAQGCYKMIFTSRHTKPEVQAWYEKLGFKNHGVEFRIDLSK